MGKDKKIRKAYNGLVLYDYNEKNLGKHILKIVLKPIK